MKILTIDNLPDSQFHATAVTIGNFDGVHIGHQRLIRIAVEEAHQRQISSVAMTFHPHPAAFFRPDQIPATISSRFHKERLIAQLNVDALLTLRFDAHLAALTPEDYFQYILLEKLCTRVICVGYDFTFGKNRAGNVRVLLEMAERYDVDTRILEPQRIHGHVVSSTRIREFLGRGLVLEAAELLGRYHVLHGDVVTGDGIGQRLGYPTVNLDVQGELIPGPGIYSGLARINNDVLACAIYIGTRPTHGGGAPRVEAHLLDFSGDLYQHRITLAFLSFIRPEEKFESEQSLIRQIGADCNTAREDAIACLQSPTFPIIW